MWICGLDPGLNRTGYGIIRADEAAMELIDAGLISTSVRWSLPDRLTKLHDELDELFNEYPKIDTVAIEEVYSHYRHPRTAVLMAHARGVMLFAANARRLRIVNLPATMVKKALTGTGRAGKVQVQRSVVARLGVAVGRDLPVDVTDALALAVCCYEHGRSLPH